jgi:hypothetical protein
VDQTFVLKVVLSFLIAGTWIGGATLLAERLGSRVGGLVINLPSTILIALLFVALVHDPVFAARATRAVPVGMTIDTLFLAVFIITVRAGLRVALPLSLATWFALALLASLIQGVTFSFGVGLYLTVTLLIWYGLERVLHIPARERQARRYTPAAVLIRVLFAGGVVSGTVLLSRVVGTWWTGLFSTFPAVMLSSMCILTVVQGPDFARATGKVMIPASTNILVYAGLVALTYPVLGLVAGTIVSFLVAAGWVALLHPVIQRISH